MDTVARARELATQGRFTEALSQLDLARSGRTDFQHLLLRAQLCEATGHHEAAAELIEHLARTRGIPDHARAASELVRARLAAEHGPTDREFEFLQRALALAERASAQEQIAWIQLRQLALSADRNGLDSCSALMSQVRHNVSCVGDPNLSAAMHLVVADIDGKHGLLGKSRRHVTLARNILERYPNLWLSAWAESTLLALAIVQSDAVSAGVHSTRALSDARACGAHGVLRSALANSGRLNYLAGDFQLALTRLEEALATTTPGGSVYLGIQDSIARVFFSQQRYQESLDRLGAIAIGDRASLASGSYIHRHSLLTKGEVLASLGRTTEAHVHFDEAVALAERSGDVLLGDAARYLCDELTHVEAAAGTRRSEPIVLSPPRLTTPESTVLYERALAARLLAAGNVVGATIHRSRAERVCQAVSNLPAQIEVGRAWRALGVAYRPDDSLSLSIESVLQEVALALRHAGRPEVLGATIGDAARRGRCISASRVVLHASGHTVVSHDWGRFRRDSRIHTVGLGEVGEQRFELQFQPHDDTESDATADAISILASSGLLLERARIEREARATLWPVEELPADGDDSVVTGKMRSVMSYSRKIAPTGVTVLITGESGTGKEVVARALHRYSPRASKPFIPFNCTAVPRDLMESHLFGFKRGSFTGADRDNPGLIRAAKDGTLFLDEVGDLSLELQPKLLRFIESGEIHPVGEPQPLSVNVRIVAATNANLKQMVTDGRFREDLYYRLNVIPVEIPPLRERREEIPALAQHFALKWSHELGKGRVHVADDLMELLVLHPWPGNIRQLSNELNRMVAICEPDAELTSDLMPHSMREDVEANRRTARTQLKAPFAESLSQAVDELERDMIRRALDAHGGRVDAAARALGISRKGLYLKRQRLGL